MKSATEIKFFKNERMRLLFVIAVSMIFGMFMMPHDTPIATIADKYIFPAAAAGIGFGISIMAGIDLWKESKSPKKESA